MLHAESLGLVRRRLPSLVVQADGERPADLLLLFRVDGENILRFLLCPGNGLCRDRLPDFRRNLLLRNDLFRNGLFLRRFRNQDNLIFHDIRIRQQGLAGHDAERRGLLRGMGGSRNGSRDLGLRYNQDPGRIRNRRGSNHLVLGLHIGNRLSGPIGLQGLPARAGQQHHQGDGRRSGKAAGQPPDRGRHPPARLPGQALLYPLPKPFRLRDGIVREAFPQFVFPRVIHCRAI